MSERIESSACAGLGAELNTTAGMAREAGFRFVLQLDQDSAPTGPLIAGLASLAAGAPRAAIVAPRLAPPPGEGYRPIRYAWRNSAAPAGLRAVQFAPTSGSLLNLEAFSQVGGFRDAFFIAGLDVEWGFRAWSLGWGSYVATDLVMAHRWDEPVGAAARDAPQILRHAPVWNYYYARNVVAAARLPHMPLSWRLSSCGALAARRLCWRCGDAAARCVWWRRASPTRCAAVWAPPPRPSRTPAPRREAAPTTSLPQSSARREKFKPRGARHG